MASYRWGAHRALTQVWATLQATVLTGLPSSIGPALRAPWESQLGIAAQEASPGFHVMHKCVCPLQLSSPPAGLYWSTQPAHLIPACEHLARHLPPLVPGQVRLLGQPESR